MQKKYNIKNLALLSDLEITYPRIVLQNNQEAVVEGCLKILIYDENMIRFKSKNMEICFTGREMSLKTINSEYMIITGFFDTIEYFVETITGRRKK